MNMASNASKTHLFRALNKRQFASAAVKYAANYTNKVKVETLSNKIGVASVDSYLPLSRLSVVVKAGSRYDPAEAPGLNHVVRSSAGLSTSQSSTFGITRNIQQIGANIQVTGDRDTISYTLEATCDQLGKGVKFLKDVVVNQVFKPWELEDNIPRIKYELATLPPQARLVDLLHKAAYRKGLGNSLFVKEFNIGKYGSETLQHHVAQLFTSSRTAVVGVGVNHESVTNFAEDLHLPVASGPEVSAKYYGGELFEDAPISSTHAAIAGRAAGLKDKDVLAFAVLKYALGGWSNIKWSPGNSLLAKAVKAVDERAAVSAFNAVHADSGLFGIIVSTSPSKAKQALLAAYSVLTEKLPSDVIDRAKTQLKMDLLHSSQNGEEMAADLANQVLLSSGSYTSPSTMADAIDKISESDISSVVGMISSGKKSLASYGNLSRLAYLDEFK